MSISRVIPRGIVNIASCNLEMKPARVHWARWFINSLKLNQNGSYKANTSVENWWEGQSKFAECNTVHRNHLLPIKVHPKAKKKKTKRKFQFIYIRPDIKETFSDITENTSLDSRKEILTNKLKRREIQSASLESKSVFIKAGWTSLLDPFAWLIGVNALTRVSRAPRTCWNTLSN